MTATITCLDDIHLAIQVNTCKIFQIIKIDDPAHLEEIPDDRVIILSASSQKINALWANTLGERQNVICDRASAESINEFPKTVRFDMVDGPSDVSPSRYRIMHIKNTNQPGNFIQTELVKEIIFTGECAGVCQISEHLKCFEQVDKLIFRNTCCNSLSNTELDRLGVKKIVILVTKGITNLDNILRSTSVKSLELMFIDDATCVYSPDIDNVTITEIKFVDTYFDEELDGMAKRNNVYEYQSRLARVKPIIYEKI